MKKLQKRLVGFAFIILSILIVSVSAYVFETATQTVTQTVKDDATITIKNSALGNINEGETIAYTKTEVSELGDAISIVTTSAESNVYLHLDSDIDSLSSYYSTYNIVVKFGTVVGSTYSVGDTACTLSLGSPDYSSINLNAAGTWTFDFEITTTATQVSSDQATTVTIVTTAESTA